MRQGAVKHCRVDAVFHVSWKTNFGKRALPRQAQLAILGWETVRFSGMNSRDLIEVFRNISIRVAFAFLSSLHPVLNYNGCPFGLKRAQPTQSAICGLACRNNLYGKHDL